MKIVLNDLQDVQDLVGMLDPELLRTWQPSLGARLASKSETAADYRSRDIEGIKRQRDEGLISDRMATDKLAELGALPDDIDTPQAADGPSFGHGNVDNLVAYAASVAEGQEFPERDTDGAKYSTDWHSDPKKLTAKNVWRAKRGRDESAYKAWLLEQAVEVAEAADEPVATETHALPQAELCEDEGCVHNGVPHRCITPKDPQEAGSEPTAEPVQPASTVDLQALVAASQEAAMDAKDGLQDLLAGCRDFTSAHGTTEFNALKAAVAPRGDTGASLQEFTPAERRLMLACIANYPKPA